MSKFKDVPGKDKEGKKLKKTKFTTEELDFIRANFNYATMDDIARKLERSVDQVTEKAQIMGLYGDEDSSFNLEERPFWEQLKKQFNADELNSFLYQWNQTINQFRGDILHLEENQIVDYIRISIMLDRCYASIKQADQSYSDINEMIQQEKEKDQPDFSLMRDLEMQKGAIFSSRESVNKEIREITKEKKALLSVLKGNREQRVKTIESSKETFRAWMKQIIENRELRKRLGEDMEKMRLASELEYQRLSSLHKYIDGGVDQPILNHESIRTQE